MREINDKIKAEAERMRAKGKSWYEIARAFGVDYRRIMRAIDPIYAERERRREAARRRAETAIRVSRGSMDEPRILPEHVDERRRWMYEPDTRDLTGHLMGDPHPSRQAFIRHG